MWRFACLVSEPQALISMCLNVVAVWLSGPRAAGEGQQARKHGYGDVLPELGLATASLQASAAIFL